VPEPVEARNCWVTELPWSNDGIAVWETGALRFVVGNNLFKHAPALGRALAGDLPAELRPEAKLGLAR
jgi:sarcosine oxidase